MLAAASAFRQLEQYVETHEIRHAVLLHGGDIQSDRVLDAILRKNGITAELFIEHEETADPICGERQTDQKRSSTEGLIIRSETFPDASAFKIYKSRVPATVRAILIDDKLICTSWCTYAPKGRSGKMAFRIAPVMVVGMDHPALLAWSGTEDF